MVKKNCGTGCGYFGTAVSYIVYCLVLFQCDPNLLVFSVWIDTLDKRLPRLAFFTSRNISAGEELTFDYQMSRNRDYTNVSGSRTRCLCGSQSCYGYID